MDANNNTNGEGSVGPVIATIIILAVVVLGGLYFWGQRNTGSETDIYGNPISSTTPASALPDTSAIDTQSSSDNPTSIQNDLKSTDTNNLGAGINAS